MWTVPLFAHREKNPSVHLLFSLGPSQKLCVCSDETTCCKRDDGKARDADAFAKPLLGNILVDIMDDQDPS